MRIAGYLLFKLTVLCLRRAAQMTALDALNNDDMAALHAAAIFSNHAKAKFSSSW